MSLQPRDANAAPIPVLRPSSTEKITLSGIAVAAAAFSAGVKVVRIVADADVHYAVTGTATASDVYLPAGGVEYIKILPSDTLSVIGTGAVYVTEMS